MSINLVRYEGNTILPKNDVDLQKRIFTVNGFLSGCELSHLGSNLIRITSGKGIIQGGDFEILQEDIQVVLPSGSVGNGYLYIKVDLSDTTTPVKFLSILTDEGIAPAWVQDVNFYETNGVYELPILGYVCTNTSITSIENLAQYISSPIINLEENEADLWVSNGSYTKGNIVLYDVDKKLYRYSAPLPYNTSIPTNPLIWTQVNIGDEIVNTNAVIGLLSSLTTTVKTSIVNAINWMMGTLLPTTMTVSTVLTKPTVPVYGQTYRYYFVPCRYANLYTISNLSVMVIGLGAVTGVSVATKYTNGFSVLDTSELGNGYPVQITATLTKI